MIKNNSIQSYCGNIYFIKTEINQLLISSIGFCFLLLLVRMGYTHNITFISLVWNLFLAFIPYLLSYHITLQPTWVRKKWKFIALLIVWLLFIPNTFYIVTDLFHLYDSDAVPRWYDLLLIFSFAWNGLLMGILSVRHIEKITGSMWLYRYNWLFVYTVMWLNALGVYIGRYMRYNSWDIVSNPFHLMVDIFHMMLHPLLYKDGWAMVICFTVFLSLFYETIKKISKAIG